MCTVAEQDCAVQGGSVQLEHAMGAGQLVEGVWLRRLGRTVEASRETGARRVRE